MDNQKIPLFKKTFILIGITLFSISIFYPLQTKGAIPEDLPQGLIGTYRAPWQISGSSVWPYPYRGRWIDEEINFDSFHNLLQQRTGYSEYVRVLWEGLLYVDYSEVYTFYTDTEQESLTLWIDKGNGDWDRGKRVIGGNKITWTCGSDCQGSLFLSAGWHTIEIEYTQYGGGAAMKLYYESPNTPKQIIPKDHFRAVAHSEDQITIPAEPNPPEKISTVTAGVGMAQRDEEACGSFKNIDNTLKVTIPENVLKDDVWFIWNGKHFVDSTITINGTEIIGEAATYPGTNVTTAAYKYHVPAAWVPDTGESWTLNVADMDFYYPAWGGHLLIIEGKEPETKLDKLLITSDTAFVPSGEGEEQGGMGTDKIWLEAELQPFIAPMEVISDSGASGGKYIQAHDTSAAFKGRLYTYFRILPQPDPEANYVVWARVKTLSSSNNSFSNIRIDGQHLGSWDVSVTGDDWQWQKIPYSFENKCGTGSDCSKSVCIATGKDELNNGLQVIIPFIDETKPKRRLQIKVWGKYESTWLGSEMMIFEFLPHEESMIIEPIFTFGNGETRYETKVEPRPNYLYWHHGSGPAPGPDSNGKLPDLAEIETNCSPYTNSEGETSYSCRQYIDLEAEKPGKLLVPTAAEIFDRHNYVPGFEENPPSSWFPGFSREGAQFDVISPNYQQNQAVLPPDLKSLGNGQIEPLTLDSGDKWVAFQFFSFSGRVGSEIQTGYPESLYWTGGATMGSIVTTNLPPSATSLSVGEGNYCFSPQPPIFLNWQFLDPDPGDRQSAYQIQIDNNADFSSLIIDSGKIESDSETYAPINLAYNTTYYWRVKVWDKKDLSSEWSYGLSFRTPSHPYPWPDFDWTPPRISAEEIVNFTDKTTFYGPDWSRSWEWDFDYNESEGFTVNSTIQNPDHAYLIPKSYTVRLRSCDDVGCCPVDKNLDIGYPLPGWHEIPPF